MNWSYFSFYNLTYIYIYIFWQHFLIHTYLIEHNRHFLSTYFFVNPFNFLYWSYDIWRESVDKPSLISYLPSTFCPTMGHHQGRMYYKSDVNFVCTLLLCKNVSMKKCCQNIHILNSMNLQLINITALWNTNVILGRYKLHSVRITSIHKILRHYILETYNPNLIEFWKQC